MNTSEKNTQQSPRTTVWIVAFAIVITTLVLDAGALAWSASIIDGRQLTAEIFTFIVIASGIAITTWTMKVR